MAKAETDISEIKGYLSRQVNPILEQLMIELIHKRPAQPADFMKAWLLKSGAQIQRKIAASLNNRPEGLNSSSASDASDGDAPQPAAPAANGAGATSRGRSGVSAEAYGEYHARGAFKPPVFPKSAAQRQTILSRIRASVVFAHLREAERDTIVDAMEVVAFAPRAAVVRQDERGDHLYVVESGTLDCFRRDAAGQRQPLLTYRAGDAFGELALLYNAPRAATVETQTDCVLLALDRATFSHVVKESIVQSRGAYLAFLRKVELFDSLTAAEKEKVCDCLTHARYEDGEYLIREGEEGDTFFCVQRGLCEAFKRNAATQRNEKVLSYGPNDYFGELALLRNTPRAASVVAVGPVEVLCIERAAFKRLCGPLEDILKRNSAKYEAIIAR